MIEHNAGLPPERRIEFRIGIRGMSYQVSDRDDAAHRSSAQTGAKLLMVD
jgi:hypothetical protein